MKKISKITAYTIAIIICAALSAIFLAKPTYAASCTTGGGKFKVNSGVNLNGTSVKVYNNWSEISGDGDFSIPSICNAGNASRGIMYMVGGLSGNLTNGWTFDANVAVGEIKPDSTTRKTLYMRGQIYKVWNTDRYAYNVGVCDKTHKSTCMSNTNHSTGAGKHVSNGAITSICSSFKRSATDSVESLGWWTNPSEGENCAITFSLSGLAKSIEDGSIEYTDLGNGIGKATMYNFRCQVKDTDSSCGGSAMQFLFLMSILSKEANFTGTTTKEDPTRDGGTFTMKFNHTIERTSGDTFSANNTYSTSPRRDGVSGPAAPSGQSGTWSSTKVGDKKTGIQDVIQDYINPGQKVKYCSKLNYYSKIILQGSSYSHTDASTTELCSEISRPDATYTASITPSVVITTGEAATAQTAVTSSTTGKTRDNSVRVYDSSHTITFVDKITRTDDATTGAGGELGNAWTVATKNSSSASYPTSGTGFNSGTLSGFSSGDEKSITIGSITTTSHSVTTNPGQSLTRCNRLGYQSRLSWNNSTNVANNTTDAISICQEVHREKATFTGSVGLKVGTDASHLNSVTGTPTNPYVYDTTANNGRVTISISDTITRTDTNATTTAGGTVGSKWKAQITDHMGTRTGTDVGGTASLGYVAPDNTSVVKTYDSYTYDLNYGETITVCGILSYQKEINYDVYGTKYPVESKYNCVKLTRDPESPPCEPGDPACDPQHVTTCNDGASSDNLLLLGESPSVNGGRIGAINDTTGAMAFTAGGRSLFDRNAPSSAASSASIWARPGDTIHFEAIGCAAAQYKQYTFNQHFSHSNHQVTIQDIDYDITGSSTSTNHGNTDGTARNNKFKFGTEISFDNSSPSKFVGGYNVRKGLGYDGTAWSNPSTSNTTSYGCAPDTGTTPAFGGSGHYQVSGKVVYGDDGTMSYPCSGTSTLDVGSSFSNSLNFTGLRVYGVTKVGDGASSEDVIIDEVDTGEDITRYSYDLVYDSLGTFEVKASVKVPYNYILKPYISKSGHATTSDPDNGVVYSGSTINFNAGIAVAARKNTAFTNTDYDTYATITKKTTVQTRYYVRNGSNYTFLTSDGATTSSTGWTTVLSGKRFNSGGNLAGMYDNNTIYTSGGANISSTASNKFRIKVPANTPIGAQVCMQIRAYPADSHDSSIETVSGAGTGNIALSETGSSNTDNTTSTACYTVAKKPSFSSEGSNAYSGGSYGFVTSVANRANSDTGSTYKHGSWSEYGVYGRVMTSDLRGMASGATYAYATGNNGQGSSVNSTRSATSGVSTTSNTNLCTISTQTFTNDKCDIGEIGLQGMGKNSATQYRDRIMSRFTSGNAAPISASDIWASSSNHSSTGTCPTSVSDPHSESSKPSCFTAGGVNYVYLSKFNSGNTPANRDANGTSHIVVDKNIPVYKGSGNSTLISYFLTQNLENSDERNFTYVYEVGTLVIDGNLYVGEYINSSSSDKDPTLYNPNQMRQEIIAADKVYITGRVTNIDATIIANEIDTCAYATFDDFKAGKRVAVNANSNQRQLDSTTCNENLVITAPVIAKKIIMHRTYGGGYSGNSYSSGSEVQRGEIFYLRPDLFLWSYSQMQRYSQAVTVNSRELPTRY